MINDYGFQNGGAESAILNLRQGLESRGDVIRIFSSSAGLNDNGFANDVCRGTHSSFRTLLQTANPWAPVALKRVLESFEPDVVHLNLFLTQLSPFILPMLRRVPCVYHAHWQRAICPTGTRILPGGERCETTSGTTCYTGGCLQLRDWAPLMVQMGLLRLWKDSIDRIVVGSEALQTRLHEGGFPGVEVIPYGVPEQPPRPPLAEPPSVLFAGRLVREKGLHVLLEAFRQVLERVPSARLDVAGAGPEAEQAQKMAEEAGLGGHVKFHGWLAGDALERLYARAWVLAVPSVWEEPLGLVAVEAAARGIAAVVSDTGGLGETVIHGETGFRVKPGDPDRLAYALERLLTRRELAETMGARARFHATGSFSMEACVDGFRNLYQRLL
jgi:glycosyltransferase involved in cell wall biosynthesis